MSDDEVQSESDETYDFEPFRTVVVTVDEVDMFDVDLILVAEAVNCEPWCRGPDSGAEHVESKLRRRSQLLRALGKKSTLTLDMRYEVEGG